jgi:hypothetical protein
VPFFVSIRHPFWNLPQCSHMELDPVASRRQTLTVTLLVVACLLAVLSLLFAVLAWRNSRNAVAHIRTYTASAPTVVRDVPLVTEPTEQELVNPTLPVAEETHGVPATTLTVLAQPEPPQPATSTATTTSKQYVLLAFDGSKDPKMWRDTMQFARDMQAANAPVHFTYFASGVYFLPYDKRMAYVPPAHATGTSAIGFAYSTKDVADRIGYVNQAINEGHEVGSHANGHYDGSKWTEAQWDSELQQFSAFTQHTDMFADYPNEPMARRQIAFPQEGKLGFRAPELGNDAAMFKSLAKEGYLYDTSKVGKPEAFPYKIEGLWEVPLAKIWYGNTSSSILSMDYNFYFKQSGAKDTAKKGTPEWQQMYDDMLTSYRRYFDLNYHGTRAPVQIGHHFSLWNDGVYWEVMKAFAKEVCGKPDVSCTTIGAYVKTLGN